MSQVELREDSESIHVRMTSGDKTKLNLACVTCIKGVNE